MKKIALAATLLAIAASAFAQAERSEASAENPMAGWKPPRITNEQKDRQEIQALLKQFEGAGKNGDIDAAVVLLDFPVLMITDSSKGEAMSDSWTKEKWVEEMRPFYKKPMPAVTSKPTITVLSDSLAVVTNQWSMAVGKQKISVRSAVQLVRIDGKWRIKSMMEGGWGDVMGTSAASAGATSTGAGATSGAGASPETGSTTGTGTSTGADTTSGTGTSTGAGSTDTTRSTPSTGTPPTERK